MRGRRRLGHRPLLHRLRAAAQRRHQRDVGGGARLPEQGHLVGAGRALRGVDPLHGADRDPHLHQVGRRDPRRIGSLLAAPAGLGRRADQPQGLALVPAGDRRRPLPDRRHLVADRDRRDHDLAAAGDHRDQAGLGDDALPRGRGRGRRRERGGAGRRRPGPAGPQAALAVDAAHPLQGGRPLRRDLLLPLRQGDLPGRRRRPQGRGRLLLGDRADRRRRQRLRPPALDRRGRVGDRRPRESRRGGGDRPVRRGHRPGDLRLRHPAGQRRAEATSCSRTSAPPWPSGSASSPGRSGSSGPTTCRRPAPARSCAACCATSPRAARWAT